MKMNNYRQRFIISVIVAMVVFAIPASSIQAQCPQLEIEGVVVYVDCYEQRLEIVDGRVLAPVSILNELGISVSLNSDNESLLLRRPSAYFIYLVLGESRMSANAGSVTLDVPAQIINGTIMTPVRAIAETFGFSVVWSESQQIVEIRKDGIERRDSVPELSGYLGGFSLRLSPDELISTLGEKGMHLTDGVTQDWATIYEHIDFPVRDGRIYNLGEHDFLSFFFRVDQTGFHFSSQGIMHTMVTTDSAFQTVFGIRIGDSAERVFEVYGNGFMLHPLNDSDFSSIEYFDGEYHIAFSFVDDSVSWIRISRNSIFAVEMGWI